MLGKQKRQGFVCLMHELHAQRLVIMNHANSHSSGRGSVSRQGLCSWMGQAKHSQANHLEGAGPWATCCNPQIRNQEPPSDLQQVPRACPPNRTAPTNSRAADKSKTPALLPPFSRRPRCQKEVTNRLWVKKYITIGGQSPDPMATFEFSQRPLIMKLYC